MSTCSTLLFWSGHGGSDDYDDNYGCMVDT